MTYLRKPPWIKSKLPQGETFIWIRNIIKRHRLHTVCEEARCPNLAECWGSGTATFMIMGDICTRHCRFCAVKSGNPKGVLDRDEPRRVALAVREIGLKYVVLTSVDRDDLKDKGAHHFKETILRIKEVSPDTIIEALIPDFDGDEEALKLVVEASPDVLGHNIETVRRLTPFVRDKRASYEKSLKVLENIKRFDSSIYTKSSIMVGLGESMEEVKEAMRDLREVGVELFTVGQYLQPTPKNLKVSRYWTPDEFKELEEYGYKIGFICVASGPFVRSSYKAMEYFMEKVMKGGKNVHNKKRR